MRSWMWIALTLVGWGSWTVIQKVASRNLSPLMVQLCSAYVYSALAPIIYLTMKARRDEMVWTTKGIVWTTVASIVSTIAGYAFLFAIEKRPVHEVLSFTQLYPALSFVLCWALLGESFTLQKAFGAMLMVAGCVVMNR